MKVLLTRKYADRIDDVDLSGQRVGDVLDLPNLQARLLLLEEWAILERREAQVPTEERRRADD